MLDRSHLIQSTTVDVNGHTRTVYRAPGKQSSTQHDGRTGAVSRPPSSGATPFSTDPSVEEVSIGEGVKPNLSYRERDLISEGYVGSYNSNRTINAEYEEGGLIYFKEQGEGGLVATVTPVELYMAGIATNPVAERIPGGFRISYIGGDGDDIDNRLVSFKTNDVGSYTGEPAIVTTYASNDEAENHLERVRTKSIDF
jgi:hypothetical protein